MNRIVAAVAVAAAVLLPSALALHLNALSVVVAAATVPATLALNNGVGLSPSVGFNTWYGFHSHLSYPNYTWIPPFVLSDASLALADQLTALGLRDLGYTWINMDDCIVVGRDATGALIPDPAAFPAGPRDFADKLAAKGFKLGWYTDRGELTCSCYAGGLKRPGSLGHEAQDAATYAAWGVQYLKEDSCNDSGGFPVAVKHYQAMRDGLNATGVPVVFNMCFGDGAQLAAVGRSLANEWRIAEDDGGGWGPIMVNVNVDAGLAPYSGCAALHGNDGLGCGWNDPGLLLVGQAGMTPNQWRSHMGLWCILAAKLLISVDPSALTGVALDILSNAEAVAIDQDALGVQGVRVVPPPPTAAEAAADAAARRAAAARAAAAVGAHTGLSFAQQLKYRAGVDPSWRPEWRDLLDVVPGSSRERVVAAGGQAEVWARPLAGGDVALLFFNNNVTAPVDIACAGACWATASRGAWGPTTVVKVRDVWKRTDNGTATGGFTARGVPTDATVFLRLSPA